MAYENQNKCLGCGISIPFVHEDADSDASYCDKCLEDIKDEDEDDKEAYYVLEDSDSQVVEGSQGTVVYNIVEVKYGIRKSKVYS